MKYLHTMLRVRNLDAALHFYVETPRHEGGAPPGRREEQIHAGVPLRAGGRGGGQGEHGEDRPRSADAGADLQLGDEDYGDARHFGHLAYEVDDIYATCEKLMKGGVTINRPPRDGNMAFVRSPDKQSIEILQKGKPLPPKEPWASMPNTGHW